MINFNEFYLNLYSEFKESIDKNNIMPDKPIEYRINPDLKVAALYNSDNIIFKSDKIESQSQRKVESTIYHELTHYYDDLQFYKFRYSENERKILGLTFSEIHASFIGTLCYLGCKNLSNKQKISVNQILDNTTKVGNFLAFTIANTQREKSILEFKNAMYLLGYKRAIQFIIQEADRFNRVLNYNNLFEDLIRKYVIEIDSLIDFNNYSNINVKKLSSNKLYVENELRKRAIEKLLK